MPNPLRHLSLIFCLLALGAAAGRVPKAVSPQFAAPRSGTQQAALPVELVSERLNSGDGANPTAASLSQLANGQIALAWLADNQEGERAIWLSLQDKNAWGAPRLIASRASTAGATFSRIGQLGKPIMHAEGGWLHLWYAAAVFGETGGTQLLHSVSTDAGKSWQPAQRLAGAAFSLLSPLPSAPPLLMADGGLGLPLSQPFLFPHGAWLRLAATGQIVDKIRLPQDAPAEQAALAQVDTNRAIAALGVSGEHAGPVRVAHTTDGGQTWENDDHSAEQRPLLKPQSAIALLRLASGRLLLAGNPADDRQTLQLWLSADAGQSWTSSKLIDQADDAAAEFSHPSLLQARDGRIHLVYSWRRQALKHLRFTEAWLDTPSP